MCHNYCSDRPKLLYVRKMRVFGRRDPASDNPQLSIRHKVFQVEFAIFSIRLGLYGY